MQPAGYYEDLDRRLWMVRVHQSLGEEKEAKEAFFQTSFFDTFARFLIVVGSNIPEMENIPREFSYCA
jgi:hypothetical protein